jgi:hypothetical protein
MGDGIGMIGSVCAINGRTYVIEPGIQLERVVMRKRTFRLSF